MSASGTNGWDAVFAMNTAQINQIFFQHYLKEGPARQASALRFVVDAEQPNQYYVLAAELGPPEVNLEKNKLQMFIISGKLFFVDSGLVDWVLPIAHDSLLTGTLQFDKITGKDVAGNVVLNLAAAAFDPSISGVDPASTLPGLMSQAISTYYRNNATQIPLGTIVTGELTPALQPKTFHFYTQQKPDSDETCLVLFIQTNGQDGKIAPLTSYPISAQNTVELVISDAAIFGGIVPLSPVPGLSLSGVQDQQGHWSTVANGTIDAGYAGDTEEPGVLGYSSDRYGNYAEILVPVNNLKISADQGHLTASWSTSWTQYYISPIRWPCHLDMTASFVMASSPKVNPDTCVVSFDGNGKADVSGGTDFLDACNITPLQITGAIQESLNPIQSISLLQLNTFALANLIFPSGHKVRLSSVELPTDLALHGSLVVPLAVQPDRATVAPKLTQQFTVAGVQAVSWAVSPPGRGTISVSGLYTAPANLPQTEVAVITAIDKNDLNKVGYAMVVIEQPKSKTGIVISPGTTWIAAGKSVAFNVTSDTGTPLEASVKLDPDGMGTLAEGDSTGQWTYTAPSQVTSPSVAKVVATSADKSKTGEAQFKLMPSSVVIDISPASPDIAAGGSVNFTVKGGDNLTWMAWPIGTITGDDSGAKYSAPANIQGEQRVRVIAYSVHPEKGAKLGIAHVKIASSV
jgi:hypothetical protein